MEKLKVSIWQMIREAIDSLGGKASYSEIKAHIHSVYGEVNNSALTAQIIVCTVNHASRIHYPENKKIRVADSRYDFLYRTGRGNVVIYKPEEHGIWEIYEDEYGGLKIRQQFESEIDEFTNEELEIIDDYKFPLEAGLRDFIIKNLSNLKINGKKLSLYSDPLTSRDGKEYSTSVGRIDILTIDESENFYVFELKLDRGPDNAVGQLLRYMGWVKAKLSKGKDVHGVVVAKKIDEKLKYAVSIIPNVVVYEYAIEFNLKDIKL